MPTMNTSDNHLVVEIVGTLNLRFKHLNPSVYYEVRWNDSWCLVSCTHRHATLQEAANCRRTKPAGAFVFKMEDGAPHQLGGAEEDTVKRFRR
jgi:hypothetical protein